MPTVRILDELNTPLLELPLVARARLARYLPDRAVQLMALRPVAAALGKRLSETATTPVAVELAATETIAIGGAGDLSLDAGMRVTVGVHHADELLFPADDLRDAISVPSGTAYVSVTLSPRVAAALDGQRGPLAFGFAAGATLALRFFHPFDVAGQDPTLADALALTLTQFVIPADVEDLAAIAPGCYASLEGDGHVHVRGTVELASVTNPLATASLPVLGTAGITAGASATIGADWRASGRFEVRVAKQDADRVRLAYYRQAGSEVTIEAKASVGIAASVRDSDALRLFIRAVSSDPEADLAQLIDAGLSDARIEALQQAVAASVDRSLRAATEMQFSAVRRGEAVFAYDIVPSALTGEDRTAVEAALGGRLTAITDAARAEGAVRLAQTGLLSRRERRVTWRINLFGILNVRSVAELVRKGSLSYDPASGSLNAADEIASEKILVRTRPFEADGAKVRKLAFESMVLTAAYQASRAAAGLALRCSASHFEARQRTTSRDLLADYHAVIGLQLADAAERTRRIGTEHDFGPSTFLVECTFDAGAADALFIGPQGARPREYYERTGRDALLALVPAGDAERAHRRRAVESDQSWAALRAAGPAAARPQLERTLDAVRAGHIISDYVLIQWWADAMHGAATALMTMRQFLHGRTAADLAGDPEFARRRRILEKELADAVKESRSQFGDPWGILALDRASGRRAAVQATIVSPRLTATYSERLRTAQETAAAAGVRGAAAVPALVRKARRPFTADERELLRRHAVNLRLGALSADGEFQTAEADVRRIFAELLPQELEARKAEGRKLRLLFYAHGGLTGEREGLEPVLARLKFWRRNHVYPLSFVWETGLRETIADILRGLTGARDMAARGIGEDLADAFLEVAARPAGQRVWSQMKRSAEISVLEGGGAAFVARLARDFWQARHGGMEIHAAGHSAGAIFQAHFLPALLAAAPGDAPLSVRTLHLLAPACTTALFTAKLAGLVGEGKGIEALTMYTMNKSLELDDRAGPYRKSLLYLVSRAFEPEQPTRILGLEESIRQEVGLVRFFGLAGSDRRAGLIFSKTAPDAPLDSRSLSTTHGGFDDDAATMNSVMRRVLDVPDSVPIVDFVQEDLTAAQPATVSAAIAGPLDAERAADPEPLPASAAALVEAPSVIAQPAVASGGGARRALCVGIDRYGDGYDLAGCVHDATNWARRLAEVGFDVTSLHDETATRATILSALDSLVNGARAGDVIVFQFAGHGTQVDDLDGDEEDAFDEAFCPADFAQGHLLIDDDVRAVVAGLAPAVNLTCFIDCCHSGTITRAMRPGARPALVPPGSRPRFIRYSRELNDRHRAFRAASASTGEASRAVRSLGGQVMKEVCFSACQPHEVAYETAGAGQFTTHALGVLAAATGLTHEAFLERVVSAFGTRAAQRPHLDCTAQALGQRLLEPAAARSAVPAALRP